MTFLLTTAATTLTRSQHRGSYPDPPPNANDNRRSLAAFTAAAATFFSAVAFVCAILTVHLNHTQTTTPVNATVTATHQVSVDSGCTVKTCLTECGSDQCYTKRWATAVRTTTGRTLTLNRTDRAATGSRIITYRASNGTWSSTPYHSWSPTAVWLAYLIGAAVLTILASIFCACVLYY